MKFRNIDNTRMSNTICMKLVDNNLIFIEKYAIEQWSWKITWKLVEHQAAEITPPQIQC